MGSIFLIFSLGLGFFLKMFWSFQSKRFEILQRIFQKRNGCFFQKIGVFFLSKGIVFFENRFSVF